MGSTKMGQNADKVSIERGSQKNLETLLLTVKNKHMEYSSIRTPAEEKTFFLDPHRGVVSVDGDWKGIKGFCFLNSFIDCDSATEVFFFATKRNISKSRNFSWLTLL